MNCADFVTDKLTHFQLYDNQVIFFHKLDADKPLSGAAWRAFKKKSSTK